MEPTPTPIAPPPPAVVMPTGQPTAPSEPPKQSSGKLKWLLIVPAAIILIPFALLIIYLIYIVATGGLQASAYQVCNGLEAEAKPATQAAMANQQIDGKIYTCGELEGAAPHRVTAITYTLRGAYNKAQTTAGLKQQVDQQLQSGGWKKQPTTFNDELPYDFVLAANPQIVARYGVVSPKYSLYKLEVRASSEYKAEPGVSRARPQNIALPTDELEKYRSFTVFKPTYLPPGYKTWEQIKDYVNTDGDNTSMSFKLTGGASRGSVGLTEDLFEPGDSPVEPCSGACKQVYASIKGNPIYAGRPVSGYPGKYDQLVIIDGDTRVAFVWPLGRDATELTNDEAVKILGSLQ